MNRFQESIDDSVSNLIYNSVCDLIFNLVDINLVWVVRRSVNNQLNTSVGNLIHNSVINSVRRKYE